MLILNRSLIYSHLLCQEEVVFVDVCGAPGAWSKYLFRLGNLVGKWLWMLMVCWHVIIDAIHEFSVSV